ncbi:MAG: TrkA C-terminal domain-containing protein, partial [Methylotenera sp.]|nr:TrkA C-terminal domain-containing protein [Flavobacterium sp.]
ELKDEEFIGATIRDSQLREKTNALIVGIERSGRRILNPESNMILEKNDILWVVGSKKLLTTFFKN